MHTTMPHKHATMQRRALTMLLVVSACAAADTDYGVLFDLPGVAEAAREAAARAAHEAATRACAGDSAGHPACAGLAESRRQLIGTPAEDTSSVLNIISTNQGEAAINFATVSACRPCYLSCSPPLTQSFPSLSTAVCFCVS